MAGMVEILNSTGSNHGIENNGKVLPIVTTSEFSTSCKQLAEASGKKVETIVQEILLGGTQLLEKSIMEHCDVVIAEFTDSKVCRMRGFKKKKTAPIV